MTDILKSIVEKLQTQKIIKVSTFETCSRRSLFASDVIEIILEDKTEIGLTLKSYDMRDPKKIM